MVDIQNYIKLSSTAASINDVFTEPDKFLKDFNEIYENERKLFLRHFIISNHPYAFKTNPILFQVGDTSFSNKINRKRKDWLFNK